jgi:hypothetical protein
VEGAAGGGPAAKRSTPGDQPAERHRQGREPGDLDLLRPANDLGDGGVQHIRLLAQHLRRAQDVGLRRGMHLPQRRHQPVAHGGARVQVGVVVAGVLAPCQSPGPAVGGGVLAREAQQGPH